MKYKFNVRQYNNILTKKKYAVIIEMYDNYDNLQKTVVKVCQDSDNYYTLIFFINESDKQAFIVVDKYFDVFCACYDFEMSDIFNACVSYAAFLQDRQHFQCVKESTETFESDLILDFSIDFILDKY